MDTPTAPVPAVELPLWRRLYDQWNEPLYMFVLFYCLYAVSGTLKATPYLAHVYLAKAMLAGHFYIDDLPGYMEQTQYLGHTYVAYGIAPSLLMLPFIPFFGLGFPQSLFCAGLGAGTVTLWWLVLGKLDLEPYYRNWLTACFGIGSLFWFYAGQNGGTWALMHVVVCFALMFAIYDVVGAQRAWPAGLGLGLAVLSRQTVFLALPFFVAMLWRDDRPTGGRSIPRKALLFGVALAMPLAFNAYYNYARFGSPMDNGYARVINEYQKLPWGFFHPNYLWNNLGVYIWGLPERINHFPWFNPGMNGFSIFLSMPALLLVFFANWRARINVFAALAILPILAFYLIYHWTGFAQFGTRYAIDFYPFAMLLIASACRNRFPTALASCVMLGALVEVWGLFWWGLKEW